MERPFFAVPHLSCRFLAVPPRFSPVFHDFGQKQEKNGCPKMEERERKERVSFPFLSRSRFFPFRSAHMSSPHAVQVALATDPWGAVQAHPAGNGVMEDNQGHDQVADNCCYVGERRGEGKLLLRECRQAQERKDGVRPTSRTFRIILISQ